MALYGKLLILNVLMCLLAFKCYGEPLKLQINCEAAVLMNAKTGQILYEKNGHDLHFPASITKVATTLYALEKAKDRLDEKVTADQECIASISTEAKKRSNYTMPSFWIEQASTHMGIKRGEEFKLKDLLYGVMVASANDASNVVAKSVGGTIPQFMTGLNEYITSLNCKNTFFMNPHGLHHPKHQTTAFDMALITKEAMKHPEFNEMVAVTRCTRPKTNKQEATVILQKNRLLRAGKYFYKPAVGVKTGYTSIARHTLVAAANKEDRLLIAVLMKGEDSEDVYKDAIILFEAAFNEKKVEKNLLKKGPQTFTKKIEGGNKEISTYLKDDLNISYYPAEEPELKCYLKWHDNKIPIKKDVEVAEVHLKNKAGDLIDKRALFSNDDVDHTWGSWIQNLI